MVSAYKECAKLTIEANKIITKNIMIPIQIKFDYSLMNTVMRIVKEYNLEISKQDMSVKCVFDILTTKENNVIVTSQFERYSGIFLSNDR